MGREMAGMMRCGRCRRAQLLRKFADNPASGVGNATRLRKKLYESTRNAPCCWSCAYLDGVAIDNECGDGGVDHDAEGAATGEAFVRDNPDSFGVLLRIKDLAAGGVRMHHGGDFVSLCSEMRVVAEKHVPDSTWAGRVLDVVLKRILDNLSHCRAHFVGGFQVHGRRVFEDVPDAITAYSFVDRGAPEWVPAVRRKSRKDFILANDEALGGTAAEVFDTGMAPTKAVFVDVFQRRYGTVFLFDRSYGPDMSGAAAYIYDNYIARG